jgi:hypothetical protein
VSRCDEVDDFDPSDAFDQDRAEVWHLQRTTGCTVAEALAILDRRDAARHCEHGHPVDISACGQCPCPTGGDHAFAKQDSGDAYNTVHHWWACDECGALPPTREDDDL